MKRLTLFLFLLLLVATSAACNKEEATPEPQKPIAVDIGEEEGDKPEPKEKEVFLYQFPLTGVGTNEEINHRPFGVMIENTRSARPQSGLYKADLVYEVLSEATITRLLAFYHSEHPEIIGPVRSARDYYIRLNNGYNGIYVSAGGSPQAFAMFQSRQVDYISGLDYDGRFFYRSKDRRAPHNMYTSYDNLVKAAEHAKRPLDVPPPSLPFIDKDAKMVGEMATKVSINYGSSANNVEYKYDSNEKHYLRFIGGEQSLDLETKHPVVVKNIFIVEMTHRVIDNEGRRDIDTASGGIGYLIQNGVYRPVQWENKNGQILPVNTGEVIGFLPGKTWINIVPKLEAAVEIN